MNTSRNTIIIVLLAIIILAGIFIWKSNTPQPTPTTNQPDLGTVQELPGENNNEPTPTNNDPMAGWKEYKSEALGIGFRYPKDWNVTNNTYDDSNNSERIFFVYVSIDGSKSALCENQKCDSSVPGLILSFTKKTLQDILSYKKTSYFDPAMYPTEENAVSVTKPLNGLTGTLPTDIGLEVQYYYFEISPDTRVYVEDYIDTPFHDINQKVLSTLEKLEVNGGSLTNVKNWGLYNNPDFSIGFYYPSQDYEVTHVNVNEVYPSGYANFEEFSLTSKNQSYPVINIKNLVEKQKDIFLNGTTIFDNTCNDTDTYIYCEVRGEKIYRIGYDPSSYGENGSSLWYQVTQLSKKEDILSVVTIILDADVYGSNDPRDYIVSSDKIGKGFYAEKLAKTFFELDYLSD